MSATATTQALTQLEFEGDDFEIFLLHFEVGVFSLEFVVIGRLERHFCIVEA